MLPKELNGRLVGKMSRPWGEAGVLWLGRVPDLTLSLPFQRVKQCVGTVTLNPSNDPLDINCDEVRSPPLV